MSQGGAPRRAVLVMDEITEGKEEEKKAAGISLQAHTSTNAQLIFSFRVSYLGKKNVLSNKLIPCILHRGPTTASSHNSLQVDQPIHLSIPL